MKVAFCLCLLLTVVLGYFIGRISLVEDKLADESIDESEAVLAEVRQQVEVEPDSSAVEVDASLDRLLGEPSAWGRNLAMFEYTQALPDAALAATARLLSHRLDEPDADRLMDLVLGRWAEVDRGAVMTFALELHDLGARCAGILGQQAEEWARVDEQAVLEFIDAFNGNSGPKNRMREAVLRVMAANDPHAALKYYRDNEQQVGRLFGVLNRIFENLAEVDLERAELEFSNSSAKDRLLIVRGFVSYYSRVDPQAGLAFVESLSPGMRQNSQAEYYLMGRWIQRDPTGAMSALLDLGAGQFREHIISSSIGRWARADLDAALGWVMPRLDDPVVANSFQSIVRSMAETDPMRGLELIDQHPELEASRDGLLRGWMEHDTDAAIEWATENLTGGARATLFREAIDLALRSFPVCDIEKAVYLIDVMPLGKERDHALSTVAATMAQHDGVAAMEWVAGQPEDGARLNAISSVLQVWTIADSSAATSYIITMSDENPRFKQQCVEAVVGAWAQTEPQAALAWANEFTDGPTREAAVNEAIYNWAYKDVEGALTYVLTQPEMAKRTQKIERFMLLAGGADSEYAVRVYGELSESEQSETVTRSLVSGWARNDPLGASEWVDTLPDGHERDVAAGELVKQIAQSPKDALPWALQIENQKLRNQALGAVASGAKNLDSEIVRQAIDAISGDDQEQARLRQRYLKE